MKSEPFGLSYYSNLQNINLTKLLKGDKGTRPLRRSRRDFLCSGISCLENLL